MPHNATNATRRAGHNASGRGGVEAPQGAGAGGGRPIDYQRIIKLFVNKHTEGLVDRQVSAIQRLVRKNQEGYFIKDLPAIEELLHLVSGRVEAGAEVFREPLAGMVTLCGKPFRRSTSHEEFRRMDAVVSFVRAVADLLSINDAPLQVSVAQALQQVMRGYLPQGQRRRDDTAWKYNHEIATKAHVADMVVARLAAELDELMTYDADGDNKINAEEMHNAVVDNDADATNDDEAFNETKAADMVRGGQIVRPPYLLGLLVKLVWELSSHGPNSQQLVVQGTPQLLMRLLSAVEDYREQVVYLSIEALWNMLEHSKHHLAQGDICISLKSLLKKHRAANAAYLLANEAAVVTLTSLLERLLLFGFKKADKMLRNEVIVVAALIAERKSAVPLFVQSGFLSLLLEYGVAAEMELPVDANPRNFATSDPVDLEFKTLAWGVVAAMSVASEDAMARVNESLFVQTLLLYLNPSHHHGNRYLQIWAPTQRRSLDLLAGRLLSQIAPQCVSLINSYHGAMVALNHIRSHSSILSTPPVDDDDGEAATELGEDASVDAPPVDDTEDDVDRQYAALCLLQVTCTEDQQTVLGENGAIEDLLTLLSGINATVPPPAEVAPTATVTAATATPSDLSAGLLVEAVFTALSMLCRGGHEDNQTRFRRAGGVSALLAWLRYDPEDAVVKPLAVVPVVAALWEAVVGNRRSEARFIADEGTIALLDLLDVCPSLARGQVVGVLADLLLNPRSHAYVKSWRSDSSGDDAVVVLLALWDSEERRLGITRAPDGSLADPMRPLDVAVPTAVPGGAGDGGLGGTGSGSGSGEGTPRSPNGSPKGDKPAFDRLRRALKASKLWTRVGGEEPTAKLQRSLGAADLRPKIYAVLASLGMEYDDEAYEKLSWQHKLAFCVARRYFPFREGHLWLDISNDMAKERVNNIRADLLQVERELDAMYHEALAAQHEQHEIVSGKDGAMQQSDEKFFETIRMQKAGEEAAFLLSQSQNPVARAKARAARARSRVG